MLSSKLMTMKFMTSASDSGNSSMNPASIDKTLSDSHWQLNTKKSDRLKQAIAVEKTHSYTGFSEISGGRRHYGSRKGGQETTQAERQTQSESSDEEAPEDRYARQRDDKESDRMKLQKMQGMTSLSGASKKRKIPRASSGTQKKNRS